MSLSTILDAFITDADEPDADALGNAIRRLANESARCVADHTCGEVAAIAQRSGAALIWIDAEQRDPTAAPTSARAVKAKMVRRAPIPASPDAFIQPPTRDQFMGGGRNGRGLS